MNPSPELRRRLHSVGKKALLVGVAALALCLVGGSLRPAAFFRSYLIGFLFWAGIALGSLAVLSLHQVVGGEWGFVSRRIFEAVSRTIRWLPLFFAPVLVGAGYLYPWMVPEVVAESEILEHKAPYLNLWSFTARNVLYFAVWIVLAWRLNHWSRDQDRGERSWIPRLQLIGALGMLLYGLTISFASVDWVMSLEPEWYSTIFGLLFMVGQVLSAFAFLIPVLWLLSEEEPLSKKLDGTHFHDLGNLTLAFILLWAYMAYSQYLIIWSGNLPEEISWYLHRMRGGWQALGIGLVVFHFAVPFALLLSRRRKKDPRILTRIAAAILVARWLDLVWLVVPASRESLGIHWMDLLAPVAIGGLWLAIVSRELAVLPLLPLNDPRFTGTSSTEEAVQHG